MRVGSGPAEDLQKYVQSKRKTKNSMKLTSNHNRFSTAHYSLRHDASRSFATAPTIEELATFIEKSIESFIYASKHSLIHIFGKNTTMLNSLRKRHLIEVSTRRSNAAFRLFRCLCVMFKNLKQSPRSIFNDEPNGSTITTLLQYTNIFERHLTINKNLTLVISSTTTATSWRCLS